jgi:mRNA interferase MazF
MFIGIPTSSKIKEGSFFYEFSFLEKSKNSQKMVRDIAILAQIKTFSSKRLLNKIGVMKQDDFEIMKNKIKSLIF